MFNLQGSEIIFILLLALVVLGPEKLPGAIRRFTRTYAELKKMSSGFQSELKSALDEPMKEMRETADLLKETADPNKLIAEAEAEEDLEADARHAVADDDDDLDDDDLDDEAGDDEAGDDDDRIEPDLDEQTDDDLADADAHPGDADDSGPPDRHDDTGESGGLEGTGDGGGGGAEPLGLDRRSRAAARGGRPRRAGGIDGDSPHHPQRAAREAFAKERAGHARAAGAAPSAPAEVDEAPVGDDADDVIAMPSEVSSAAGEWDDPLDEEASA